MRVGLRYGWKTEKKLDCNYGSLEAGVSSPRNRFQHFPYRRFALIRLRYAAHYGRPEGITGLSKLLAEMISMRGKAKKKTDRLLKDKYQPVRISPGRTSGKTVTLHTYTCATNYRSLRYYGSSRWLEVVETVIGWQLITRSYREFATIVLLYEPKEPMRSHIFGCNKREGFPTRQLASTEEKNMATFSFRSRT